MPPKRGGDGASSADSKRQKTGSGPAPALDIAAIRAQVAARTAALTNGGAPHTLSSFSDSARPSSSRPAASGPVGTAALPPAPRMDQSVAERLAAAKAKIEAMKTRNQNPYLSGSGSMPRAAPEPTPVPTNTSIALHPLLVDQRQTQVVEEKNVKRREKDRYKTMAPKFSTVKANQVTAPPPGKALLQQVPAPSLNPYAPTPATAGPAPEDGGGSNSRRSRRMKFSAPGKYVLQGDALRNEVKLEELKQRIADASRKAGLDSEFDTLARSLKRQPPPELEWWDEAILPPGSTYNELESGLQFITTSSESLVTHLILHPIRIAAPTDKKGEERGLMLTKKEQKKMRRQRRKAELEDKRDRQKMGLIPPDPPKVRLANLMKVLTSDAVADPTKMEAKVRREVDMRKQKHEMDNEERKMTAEERKKKDYKKMVARERKGVFAAAYKIKHLTNGRHQFKVRNTARKDLLSGVCVYHDTFALVMVEGSDKGMRHFRQLMENRIDWTEQARPLGDDEDDEDAADKAPPPQTDPESLEDNKCEMIWSGEVPDRTFSHFKTVTAASDRSAKEALRERYEGYWDLAKRHVWSGEDF